MVIQILKISIEFDIRIAIQIGIIHADKYKPKTVQVKIEALDYELYTSRQDIFIINTS